LLPTRDSLATIVNSSTIGIWRFMHCLAEEAVTAVGGRHCGEFFRSFEQGEFRCIFSFGMKKVNYSETKKAFAASKKRAFIL
jgi:hypothetical protein